MHIVCFSGSWGGGGGRGELSSCRSLQEQSWSLNVHRQPPERLVMGGVSADEQRSAGWHFILFFWTATTTRTTTNNAFYMTQAFWNTQGWSTQLGVKNYITFSGMFKTFILILTRDIRRELQLVSIVALRLSRICFHYFLSLAYFFQYNYKSMFCY